MTWANPDLFLLPHQAELLLEVELGLEEIHRGGDSVGILSIGDPGTGKTFGVDMVCRAIAQQDSGGGPPRVLRRVAAAESATSFVAALLSDMGRPATARERRDPVELKRTFFCVAKELGIQALIIEEAQSSMVAREARFRQSYHTLLREFWNGDPGDPYDWVGDRPSERNHKLLIIVTGTQELRDAIEWDEALRSRFGRTIVATLPELYPASARRFFHSLVRVLCRRHGVQSINLKDGPTVGYVYAASEQNYRTLNTLLQRVATLEKRTSKRDGIALILEAYGKPLSAGEVERRVTQSRLRSEGVKLDSGVTRPTVRKGKKVVKPAASR